MVGNTNGEALGFGEQGDITPSCHSSLDKQSEGISGEWASIDRRSDEILAQMLEENKVLRRRTKEVRAAHARVRMAQSCIGDFVVMLQELARPFSLSVCASEFPRRSLLFY